MIIHLDADAFYASVEQAENPALRGKAMAVGGLHRGIIASATYEARARGVYTPMPTTRALKVCPELVLVRGDMARYADYSRRLFSFVEEFTPLIERTSIDEGYFDVSGHRTLTPAEIAQRLKARVCEELGITVSLGIGENKLIAQIAAKLRKPDALVEVPRGTARDFLAPLPARWLPGIGPKAEERFRALGLDLVRDVAEASPDLLVRAAGGYAERLRALALGIDDRMVELGRDEAKSYGVQDTFGENVSDREAILATLRTMADGLMARVRADGKAVRTVTVKVRYPDFTEDSHGSTLDEATDLETDVFPHLSALLRGAWKRREPLRLVALRFSNICDPVFQSELLLDPAARRRASQRKAAQLLDDLRGKAFPVTRGHAVTARERRVRR
ncbi:MAG: polymerase [Chthoniobacter sp.]|jgi:DNA polymerase-4|nr:polymerase [Chthoniobacter sp.]